MLVNVCVCTESSACAVSTVRYILVCHVELKTEK